MGKLLNLRPCLLPTLALPLELDLICELNRTLCLSAAVAAIAAAITRILAAPKCHCELLRAFQEVYRLRPPGALMCCAHIYRNVFLGQSERGKSPKPKIFSLNR